MAPQIFSSCGLYVGAWKNRNKQHQERNNVGMRAKQDLCESYGGQPELPLALKCLHKHETAFSAYRTGCGSLVEAQQPCQAESGFAMRCDVAVHKPRTGIVDHESRDHPPTARQ